ncbi:MAG: lipoprotein releasing system permease [Oligoflexia bacterium]|nr:MAG: lipoprotein releasing system permease [Oligoflexia bacterium]
MLYLAYRHLISRKKQTLFTFLGVFFAACAYVVIAGFFLGFQDYLVDQLINNDAHIRVSAREEIINERDLDRNFFSEAKHIFWTVPPGGRKDETKIENPQGWYSRLEKDPRVLAYSPQMTAQVIITRANTSTTARLIGSDALKQQRVTNIKNQMKEGHFSDIAVGGNRVIVGDELLAKIGARVSETLLISNGKNTPTPFKIVGSFHIGIRSLDQGVLFAALQDVQKIAQATSQVNEIAIRVTDVENARSIAESWAKISPEQVQSWDIINSNVLNVFNIQNATRYLVTFVIVLVAGFGVYNILNMIVIQKRKDIAILRSMGFDQNEVIFLFLSQGIILGLIGGLTGVFTGYWICRYLETISFGGGPLGSGAGHMTISFSQHIYFYGMLIALISSTAASFLPARAAGKLTPIEIIRSGAE